MTRAQERLEEAKKVAVDDIKATFDQRRESIAFSAPELQSMHWQQLEDQVVAAVNGIEV